MAQLWQLIYVSSSRDLFDSSALDSLLLDCQQANKRHAITGLLLYRDGNIMQAIEGDKESVYQLYRNIEQDPRHHGLITLLERPISHREFGEWAMSLVVPGIDQPAGLSDFLRQSKHSSIDNIDLQSNAISLLESFRDSFAI